MNVVLTNLSNNIYRESRLRLNASAVSHGINQIYSYDFEGIKNTSFYRDNQKLLNQPKGMGYWAWKPYIILQTMKSISESDIVIYSDSGIEIIADLNILISLCNNEAPILIFANGDLKNKYWTKRDCFILMKCDKKKYWEGNQCDAAFCVFKKSEETIAFLEEWLMYSTDIRIIGDGPNTCGKKNFWGFQFHRHDQSILSLLALKHSLSLYRQPTEYGNHYKMLEYRVQGEFNCISQYRTRPVKFYSSKPFLNSPYKQLLNHHRTKIQMTKKVNLSLPNAILLSGKRRWGKIIKWLTRR